MSSSNSDCSRADSVDIANSARLPQKQRREMPKRSGDLRGRDDSLLKRLKALADQKKAEAETTKALPLKNSNAAQDSDEPDADENAKVARASVSTTLGDEDEEKPAPTSCDSRELEEGEEVDYEATPPPSPARSRSQTPLPSPVREVVKTPSSPPARLRTPSPFPERVQVSTPARANASSPARAHNSKPSGAILHNGEMDSDEEAVWCTSIATVPAMQAPRFWPRVTTDSTLLSMARVRPEEYYSTFTDWRREAKTNHRGAVHPIPMVLMGRETPQQYEEALAQSIRLSSDAMTQRGQRMNYAEARMRRFLATSTAAQSASGTQPRGQARPAGASSQAPTSHGQASNPANVPGTRSLARVSAGGRPNTPRGSVGGRAGRVPTAAVPAGGSAWGPAKATAAQHADLSARVQSLEDELCRTREALCRTRETLERELRRTRELGRMGYARLKQRQTDLEVLVAADRRERRSRKRRAARRPDSASPQRSCSSSPSDRSTPPSPAYSP